MEQFIRASRAQELDLVRMLPDDGVRETAAMVEALRRLPDQNAPSDVLVPGLLDGLDNVDLRIRHLITQPRRPTLLRPIRFGWRG
jgi:predicted glycosyltransferase